MRSSLPGEPVPELITGKKTDDAAGEHALPADKGGRTDQGGQERQGRLERSAVLALAADIRTCLRFHQAMGVESYPMGRGLKDFLAGPGKKVKGQHRPGQVAHPVLPPRQGQRLPAKEAAPADQLAALQRDLGDCRLCSLVSTRQGQVPGRGVTGAPLLIIGDYCRQAAEFSASSLFGPEEDVMFWNMMRAIGLLPEEVYVTNAIKCCPRASEHPPPESAEPCRVHLRREIEWVRPKIICAMGETAAWAVLGGSETVFRLRGKWHSYRSGREIGEAIRVMVTFHPRYLLANADMKKAAWEDLQMIQRNLRSPSKTGRP